MTQEELNEEFKYLVKTLQNKVFVRIIEPRHSLATMNIFTAVTKNSRSLINDNQSDHLVWLEYECSDFEVHEHQIQNKFFAIASVNAEKYKKIIGTSILDRLNKSEAKISYTAVNTDGAETTTHGRLALVYYTHLARLQGMIMGQCQFYTPFDRAHLLTVADRIGGVVHKRLTELHSAIETIKKL